MIRSTVFFASMFCPLLLCPFVARADGPILQDRNGDGGSEIIAVGDSITYGVGDGIEPGRYISQLGEVGEPGGYPLRLSSLLPASVLNAGVPGEMVFGEPDGRTPGVVRFPEVVVGSSADLVIVLEGANDAQVEISAGDFANSLQKMINVARADNKNVAIATLLPPTIQHGMFASQTALYSGIMRRLAALNDVPVIDLEQGFLTECPDLSICSYYNLPEGLHPNTAGYDAIAKMIATRLQE